MARMEEQAWYHGSPARLTILAQGSTVTQDRELARVFSHKPTIVSLEDDGTIKHNGERPGFLYIVDEEVGPGDVSPHPRTTMPQHKEWLTNRELRLRLVSPTRILPTELLTPEELSALWSRLASRGPSATPGVSSP